MDVLHKKLYTLIKLCMQINGYEFLKKYISDWIWIWIKHAHNVTRLTRKFMPCQNSGRRETPFGLRVVEQQAWEGMQKPEGHGLLWGGHTMERGWFDSLIAIHRRKLTRSFSWCIATRKSKSFMHTFYRSIPGALISLKSHLFLALT